MRSVPYCNIGASATTPTHPSLATTPRPTAHPTPPQNIVLAVVPGDDLGDATAISLAETSELLLSRLLASRLVLRLSAALGTEFLQLFINLVVNVSVGRGCGHMVGVRARAMVQLLISHPLISFLTSLPRPDPARPHSTAGGWRHIVGRPSQRASKLEVRRV